MVVLSQHVWNSRVNQIIGSLQVTKLSTAVVVAISARVSRKIVNSVGQGPACQDSTKFISLGTNNC